MLCQRFAVESQRLDIAQLLLKRSFGLHVKATPVACRQTEMSVRASVVWRSVSFKCHLGALIRAEGPRIFRDPATGKLAITARDDSLLHSDAVSRTCLPRSTTEGSSSSIPGWSEAACHVSRLTITPKQRSVC